MVAVDDNLFRIHKHTCILSESERHDNKSGGMKLDSL